MPVSDKEKLTVGSKSLGPLHYGTLILLYYHRHLQENRALLNEQGLQGKRQEVFLLSSIIRHQTLSIYTNTSIKFDYLTKVRRPSAAAHSTSARALIDAVKYPAVLSSMCLKC